MNAKVSEVIIYLNIVLGAICFGIFFNSGWFGLGMFCLLNVYLLIKEK